MIIHTLLHLLNDQIMQVSLLVKQHPKVNVSKLAGIDLLMRDYSEIQSGKDICDRISGAAKMRMKAYLHAGHDVTNASHVKLGK